MPAHARAHHTEAWARDRFATAERMREALNGRPPPTVPAAITSTSSTPTAAFIYGAPASTKADPSVVAVAETLVEMGRRFEDDKILNKRDRASTSFCAANIPAASIAVDALFTIGEIYKDDLDEPDQARATFQDFLHRYPHNRLVDDARQAIAD